MTYTKEKSDKIIKTHQQAIKDLKQQRDEATGSGGWDPSGQGQEINEDTKKKINKHEQSIENQKALQEHHGD